MIKYIDKSTPCSLYCTLYRKDTSHYDQLVFWFAKSIGQVATFQTHKNNNGADRGFCRSQALKSLTRVQDRLA